MEAEAVMALVIGLFVALIMMVIGICQIRSQDPVGFYTGEKAPDASEIKDVHRWNVSHGRMWIAYGIVIALGFIVAMALNDSILGAVPMIGGIVVPIPIMIITHHRLMKKLGTVRK